MQILTHTTWKGTKKSIGNISFPFLLFCSFSQLSIITITLFYFAYLKFFQDFNIDMIIVEVGFGGYTSEAKR